MVTLEVHCVKKLVNPENERKISKKQGLVIIMHKKHSQKLGATNQALVNARSRFSWLLWHYHATLSLMNHKIWKKIVTPPYLLKKQIAHWCNMGDALNLHFARTKRLKRKSSIHNCFAAAPHPAASCFFAKRLKWWRKKNQHIARLLCSCSYRSSLCENGQNVKRSHKRLEKQFTCG